MTRRRASAGLKHLAPRQQAARRLGAPVDHGQFARWLDLPQSPVAREGDTAEVRFSSSFVQRLWFVRRDNRLSWNARKDNGERRG